jgi:hypothetical protein
MDRRKERDDSLPALRQHNDRQGATGSHAPARTFRGWATTRYVNARIHRSQTNAGHRLGEQERTTSLRPKISNVAAALDFADQHESD